MSCHRTIILMFHSIGEKKTSLVVSKNKLIEIIEFFIKRNFIFSKLSDIDKSIKKKVILTFDDGYKDNYTILLPIIQKYNIPVTIFISTGFIGNIFKDSSEIEYEMLDVYEIKELSKSHLVEIGAHSVTHRNFTDISYNEQKQEICESIFYLENLIENKIISFAYPRGKYNNETLEILKNTSIKYAVTVKDGYYNQNNLIDNLEIKRVNITDSTSILKFYLIIYSIYPFYNSIKKGIKNVLIYFK